MQNKTCTINICKSNATTNCKPTDVKENALPVLIYQWVKHLLTACWMPCSVTTWRPCEICAAKQKQLGKTVIVGQKILVSVALYRRSIETGDACLCCRSLLLLLSISSNRTDTTVRNKTFPRSPRPVIIYSSSCQPSIFCTAFSVQKFTTTRSVKLWNTN